jgi:hypothetical protein
MNDANPPLLAVARAHVAAAARRSDKMLTELLDLNEEMIVQLRLERLSVVGTTDFIAAMIDQHELAAERLRAQLKRHESNAAHERSRDRGISMDNPLTG